MTAEEIYLCDGVRLEIWPVPRARKYKFRGDLWIWGMRVPLEKTQRREFVLGEAEARLREMRMDMDCAIKEVGKQ